jgi:hypothetical protein
MVGLSKNKLWRRDMATKTCQNCAVTEEILLPGMQARLCFQPI